MKTCVKCHEQWEGGGTICDDCIEGARFNRMQHAEEQAGLEVRCHFQRVLWFRASIALLFIAAGLSADIVLMLKFGRWHEARGLATMIGFGAALVWASRV